MSTEHRPVDEAANLVTHGLGLLLSVAAAAYLMQLVVAGQELRTIIACGIYCATLVLLYSASTLSHAFYDLQLRRLFRTVDQASIFLMIAGSFTPFAVIFLRHGWWWLLLAAMWTLAMGGVLFAIRRQNLSPRAKITYLVLGWLPALALWELYQRAPHDMLLWIVVGGAFYSTGTVFLALDTRVRYFHALWHTFVVAGSICHYIGVVVYVTAAS